MISVPLKVKPHPGDVLKARMAKAGITAYRLGNETGISPPAAYQMLTEHGPGSRKRRGITADIALRFAKFFGDDPLYWMTLQAEYDLYMASQEREIIKLVAKIRHFSEVAGMMDALTTKPVVPRKTAAKKVAKKAVKTALKKAATKKAVAKRAR